MANNDSKSPGVFRVNAYRCRCGHEWTPRNIRQKEMPRYCPKCKSAAWDKPRQRRSRTQLDRPEQDGS